MRSAYPQHYDSYSTGKGNELIPQKARYGLQPPKMASVASSSRFCYLALRSGATALGGTGEVEFEHECPITGISGIAPQMDAYIKKENIFVEVKCHELFDSHKIILKNKYFDLLFGEGNDFGFEPMRKSNNDVFEISPSKFGVNKTMLDIKQLICHLLGVKSHKKHDEKATLIYLFFKPKAPTETQQKEIDNIFNRLKSEINSVFNSDPIKMFINKNGIILGAVAEYSEVMSPLTSENIIYLYP